METMNQNNNLENQQKALVSNLCTESRNEFLLYFLKYTKDVDKAEDMTQQLFMHLLLYKGTILPVTLKGFAFQAARRLIIDDARTKARHQKLLDSYLDSSWSDIETTDACQIMTCAQVLNMEKAAIATLGKKAAEVYELNRFDGLTTDEIAERKNAKRRTIESHLYFSRRQVRQLLSRVMVIIVFCFLS